MATDITMPQLSDTMDKGTILKWFVQEGESVERGDALAEVATDKADLEIESFHEGTLLKIHAPEGQTVDVGSIIAVIGQEGESVPDAPAATPPQAEEPPKLSDEVKEEPSAQIQNKNYETSTPSPTVPKSNSSAASNSVSGPVVTLTQEHNPQTVERVKISPLAKNLAQSHGVDVAGISGTGEGGRITRKDVENFINTGSAPQSSAPTQVSQASAPAKSTPAAAPTGQERVEPLSRMRETIASRMVESVTTAPHFFATTKIDVAELVRVRAVLKQKPEYEGITFTHMITKAAGLSLRAFPRINSRYENSSIHEPQDVNIGVITALPDGLLIPVVKCADAISLSEIVVESRAMTQRARAGKPKSDDLSGGTFSISNIGRNEVEHFTAIINPGQGAILAVSSIQDEPVVKDGEVVPGKTLRVTLSVDHRIIDGVLAGEFLTHFKKLLEEPVLLFA